MPSGENNVLVINKSSRLPLGLPAILVKEPLGF
jgi:hypothetical protein